MASELALARVLLIPSIPSIPTCSVIWRRWWKISVQHTTPELIGVERLSLQRTIYIYMYIYICLSMIWNDPICISIICICNIIVYVYMHMYIYIYYSMCIVSIDKCWSCLQCMGFKEKWLVEESREHCCGSLAFLISETPPKQQMVLQGSQQKHLALGSQRGPNGDPLWKTSVVFDHAVLGAN